jgi:hypothetical protein
MQHHIELGYLVLEIPDPHLLDPVLADVVGLVRHDSLDGVAWRNDDRSQRLVVRRRARRTTPRCSGFEAVADDAFDRVVDRLAAAGFETAAGTDDECPGRRVGRLARVDGAVGCRRSRSSWGMQHAGTPYSSPLVPGGFLTEGVGFGHVVFATTGVRRVAPLPHRGTRLPAVRLARDGDRRASSWWCASTTATNATTPWPWPGRRSSCRSGSTT